MRRMAVLLLAILVAGCSSGGGSPTAASGSSSPKAELPPGPSASSGTASGTASGNATHPPGVGGHTKKLHAKRHIKVVLNNGKINVCALITSKQVNQVMQKALPRPVTQAVGTFDQCATASSARANAVHVAWAVPPGPDPAGMFRQKTNNLPSADAVHGLGSKAYCSSTSLPSSQLFVLTGTHFLEVFADSCTHAEALARVALGRL